MPISRNVKSELSAKGSAPVFGCRAWVNFDASSGTPAIRGSGNISSITDNGVGDYTVNYLQPMQDATYAATVSFVRPTAGTDFGMEANVFEYAAASVRVVTRGSSYVDSFVVSLAIFR